jgi:hypothetical protein
MKRLALLLLPVLSSCAVYDAVMMTGFDPNEYRIITEIRVDASHYKDDCGNPLLAQANAVAMARKTDLFEAYSEQIPNNRDGHKAAVSLNEIAQGLAHRYDTPPVPPLFCKLKYTSIENSAKVIQHVIGNRPR